MPYDSRVRLISLLLLGTLGTAGCVLDRGVIASERADDGGTGFDASDAFVEPALDASGDDADRPDAFVELVDAAPECAAAAPRCDVETLVTCVDGHRVLDDCASHGAYCDGTACVPQTCMPGSVVCAGTAEMRCDARGAASTTNECTRGCTTGMGCNPVTDCALAVEATVGLGTHHVDTCGQGDDTVFNSGCTRVDTSGSDLIVRLEVPARAAYRIELRVIGGDDAVLYVRRACADGATQLGCNDDGASGFGSRVDLTLDPGDYFLMLDSFRDTGEGADGRCGQMDLVVALM